MAMKVKKSLRKPSAKAKPVPQGYGWNPDLPDHRDFLYAANPEVVATLPAKIDLRPKCPAVYN
jgi:hypothetical protein